MASASAAGGHSVCPPRAGQRGDDSGDCVRAGGNATYLDAAAVEPGAGTGGTHQGVIGWPPRHDLLADGAGGPVLLQPPHPLHRPVLPAEGPAGQR